MPYSIAIDIESRTLTIRGEGVLRRADFDRLTAEAAPMLAAHGLRRVLSDYRAATLAVSIGELHQVVRAIADAIRAQGIPHTEVKRALVFATDAESFAFYETAALNRNQYIRIFRDPDAARRWLAEPDE
ncbi:MAG: hypothetical protein IPK07_05370 [Deltaproteobacteria bacterium]|nr:hypothetical protein [Deltaproteobacteria bacterium]